MPMTTVSLWRGASLLLVLIALLAGSLTTGGIPQRRDQSAATVPVAEPVSTTTNAWSPFALLLVDIQQDFFTPDLQVRHADYGAHVAELLEFCRREGMEVIHLRTEFPAPEDLSASFKVIFPDDPPCLRGTAGAEPTSFARERTGELVLHKTSFNGFSVDQLAQHLAAGGKRHLLIAGLTTDLCVFATALGAVDAGFVVTIVEDCCLSNHPAAHGFVINRYGGFLFDIVSHTAIKQRQRHWVQQLERIDSKR